MSKSNTGALGQYGSIAATNPYIQFDIGGQYVRITRFFALNTWYFITLKWKKKKAILFPGADHIDKIRTTNLQGRSGTIGKRRNSLKIL